MYERFYNFGSKPFRLTPDPSFFFASNGHRRAMAYLTYGVQQGEGFIVITGEIGAGKTTLARRLSSRLEKENVLVGEVVSTQLAPDAMVSMCAASFGLSQESSKAMQLKKFEEFLVERHQRGERALLIVDEAQNLPLGSVEELRMLSNFTHRNKPLVQSFILAQPEFRKVLFSPSLEQLRQRVIATCHLGPMSRAETQAYILHRLKAVGWEGDPSISDEAFGAIHAFTDGIPRRINLFCDRLFLAGWMDEKHAFGTTEVSEVGEELKVEFGMPEAAGAG